MEGGGERKGEGNELWGREGEGILQRINFSLPPPPTPTTNLSASSSLYSSLSLSLPLCMDLRYFDDRAESSICHCPPPRLRGAEESVAELKYLSLVGCTKTLALLH